MLEGILVLLVSMAGLADRASGMPAHACLSALRILHLAESIAWHVVLDAVRGVPGLAAPLPLGWRDCSEGLAARLLRMATVLARLLGQVCPIRRDLDYPEHGGALPIVKPRPAAATGSLAWLAMQRSAAFPCR